MGRHTWTFPKNTPSHTQTSSPSSLLPNDEGNYSTQQGGCVTEHSNLPCSIMAQELVTMESSLNKYSNSCPSHWYEPFWRRAKTVWQLSKGLERKCYSFIYKNKGSRWQCSLCALVCECLSRLEQRTDDWKWRWEMKWNKSFIDKFSVLPSSILFPNVMYTELEVCARLCEKSFLRPIMRLRLDLAARRTPHAFDF